MNSDIEKIRNMLIDYCKYDCNMRGYCSFNDCLITIENYEEYLGEDALKYYNEYIGG